MSEDLSEFLQCCMLYCCAADMTIKYTRKIPKKRRWWVRPIYENRSQQGDFENLIQEMRLYDTEMFFHYTRMTVSQFDKLLNYVGPYLLKTSNRMPLTPGHRLAITLRFLATGSSQQTLAFQFRIGKSTVCNILSETCEALWYSLRDEVFIKFSSQEWLKISKEFATKWNFPQCIGALDGKHCRVQCPPNSGSEFFNYKKYYSIVLMAMCDANYKFTVVDVGGMGSESDGGYFSRTTFGKLLEQNKINLPPPKNINNVQYPYVIVADEAFPLKQYLMRPYPGKNLNKEQSIFNYRLSRARRVIENAFGILTARWRIYQGPIIGKLKNIEHYILATICLHNFLTIDEEKKKNNNRKYCPGNYVDNETNGNVQPGEWHSQIYDSEFFNPIASIGSDNAKKSIFELRDKFAQYFVSPEGSVPWQESQIQRGIKRRIDE